MSCLLLLTANVFADGIQEQGQHATHPNLAQDSQNPISNLLGVAFENKTNFNLGNFDRTQNILVIRPVDAFQLTRGWRLVTRTVVRLFLPQPIVIQPSGQKYGLGDINPEFFICAPTVGEFMLGVGSSFILPTATDTIMGTGKWSSGPTAIIVWSHKKIVAGVLVLQLWSFAGQSNRSDVSAFIAQPFFNYNFGKGWFFYSDPIIDANWEAIDGNKWTVPLGGGFGRVFQLGHQHIKLQAGAFTNVVKPDGGANWQAQVSLTLLFPRNTQKA